MKEGWRERRERLKGKGRKRGGREEGREAASIRGKEVKIEEGSGRGRKEGRGE